MRGPAVVAAATVLVRALGAPLPGAPVPRRDVRWEGVEGRLFLPPRRGRAPGILLAGGVTPLGVDDPRIVRLADGLARTGRVVLVPSLALARHRLDEADVARIAAGVAALAAHPATHGGVAALGFSFGGAYTLLAAARPDTARYLRVVAAFGAYADLTRVLDGLLARGVDAGGRARILSALREQATDRLDDERAAAVDAAIARRLRVGELLALLPADLAALPVRLSPCRVQVDRPVLLLHALDDPVVPVAELADLQRAFPHARSWSVRLFTHVDFAPTRDLPAVASDLLAAWRFTAAFLA